MDEFQKKSNLKTKLASLYSYMSRKLLLQRIPKLILTNDIVNSNEQYGMTGYYDHTNMIIKLFITKRHPTDILRSFAHEIIHHWQNERGQLKIVSNQQYTQEDSHMRKKEMEAYLLGNILFRDWQDEQRYGSPKKSPFLISLNENLTISSPNKLKQYIKKLIDELIAQQIIISYNRDLSSGQTLPSDHVEDLANKISSELGREIQTINDRGNYEIQGGMVS